VPLQTEVKVSFERLGVRMLRTVRSSKIARTPTTPSVAFKSSSASRFFSSIMLYGLTAEGKISTDISLSGRIEGVYVKDVTSKGQNYPDILLVGNQKFEDSGLREEEGRYTSQDPGVVHDVAQFLSFSLARSPHSSITGHEVPCLPQPGYKSDVHLSVFIPAIHYVHSVNFVYEMELFVIHLIKDFTVMSSTFKDAAVDVAKGLVGEKTKLTKGLSRLHSSFGHAQLPVVEETLDNTGVDETDAGLVVELSNSRFFFDVSVQSPVIVLPSSLQREECLVAHLGEVKASNEYVCGGEGQDAMLDNSLEESVVIHAARRRTQGEIMMFNDSNISLHATETRESRQQLEDSLSEQSIPYHCHKVLKEASVSLQIEKHLKNGKSRGGRSGGVSRKDGSTAVGSVLGMPSADLVVDCKVCDPLTVQLPKKVFDQIRTTLNHGIRKKPRRGRSTDVADSSSSLDSARKTQAKDKNVHSAQAVPGAVPSD